MRSNSRRDDRGEGGSAAPFAEDERSLPASPPLPDYQGVRTSHRSPRRAGVTIALAERFAGIPIEDPARRARVDSVVRRLIECAENQKGRRCDHFACPRCQARSAKLRRRDVERMLVETPPGDKVGHLTLTVGADDLEDGRLVLVRGFARLRLRRWWTAAVRGGIGQIEILPARGGARRWNIHLHVVVWILGSVDRARLRSEWCAIVAGHDLPGSSNLIIVPRRFVPNDRDGEA